jgi:ribosomal protein S18 acetylase RimI-like enzyme
MVLMEWIFTRRSDDDLDSRDLTVSATPPISADFAVLRAMLLEEEVVNLFLLDQLDRSGLPGGSPPPWLVARDGSRGIIALAYVSRGAVGAVANTAVPWGDPVGCARIGRMVKAQGGTRMLVGPRAACDALFAGMGRPHHRRRHDQHLYVVTAPDSGPVLVTTLATEADVRSLVMMQAAMLEEDLGITAAELDMPVLRVRVRERVAAGTAWIARLRPDGPPVFTVNVGFSCPAGAQLGGTFVPPALRGQGLATRAMRGVVAQLLAQGAPRVTLHVNEQNVAAVRCYEAIGFRRVAPFRLMVM